MTVSLEVFAGYIMKLCLATFCAAIIGWERETHDKAAGLKTHILICFGSCLFTISGLHIVPSDSISEITRVIQGIATGVGFVGAGAIIKNEGNVQGVTTAAGVWVIASIGCAVGVGEYALALFSTIATFFILRFVRGLNVKKKYIKKKSEYRGYRNNNYRRYKKFTKFNDNKNTTENNNSNNS